MKSVLRRTSFLCCLPAIVLMIAPALAEQTLPQTPPVLLQMIRDDSVHRDLGLSAKQRDQILEVLQEVDGPWFRSRNLPADQQHREVTRLNERVRTKLKEILQPQQQDRVNQLIRQALGTRMVLSEDVITELELSSSVVDAFRETFVTTDKALQAVEQKRRAGEMEPQAAAQEINGLKAKERQSLVKMLDDEQKSKIGNLTGEAFDFAQVRRTYPLAPEITSAGVTWIQGGPLTLEQLRGKVVAIHFYAFQCINCQRNLPHYKAWHDDYGDKDLVIIGIQTPETSTERDVERVTAAAKLEGMEYPIIMDATVQQLGGLEQHDVADGLPDRQTGFHPTLVARRDELAGHARRTADARKHRATARRGVVMLPTVGVSVLRLAQTTAKLLVSAWDRRTCGTRNTSLPHQRRGASLL